MTFSEELATRRKFSQLAIGEWFLISPSSDTYEKVNTNEAKSLDPHKAAYRPIGIGGETRCWEYEPRAVVTIERVKP